MEEKAKELLKIFNDNGYEAYIVGGYVRDFILGKNTSDIDICTNATPKQIKEIFNDVSLPVEGYGSINISYKKKVFETTTYRMDLEYKDSRKPSKIMYTDKLIIDLRRRDFTMNTLCMDKNNHIIDLLNAKGDIENKIIKTVGIAEKKIEEDSLRILRAIRFATELNFTLDEKLKEAIFNNASSIEKLSFFRKKQELNRIFSSPNVLYGIELLKEFGLYRYLGIDVDNVKKTNDPIGIWAQVNPVSDYQFTSNEKRYIKLISEVVNNKIINDRTIYKYGNYVSSIAAQILGVQRDIIYNLYDSLPIKKISDIALKPAKIIDIICLKEKANIKIILNDLEDKILNKELLNDEGVLANYVIANFSGL